MRLGGKETKLGYYEGGFGELAWVEGGFHRIPFGGGLSPIVWGGIPLFYGTFGESPPPKGIR